mgnify:CR=1 FL=1
MIFILLLFTLYVAALVIRLRLPFSYKSESDLEHYITSKQPQSNSEVERLMQEYYNLRRH